MRRSVWKHAVHSDVEPLYFFVPGRPYHPTSAIWSYDSETPVEPGALRVMYKKNREASFWLKKCRDAFTAHVKTPYRFPIKVDLLWCCPNRAANHIHKLNQIPLFLLCKAGHYQLNGNLIHSSHSEIQIVTDKEKEGLHVWIEPIEAIRYKNEE